MVRPMTAVMHRSEIDIRERILVTAERLFAKIATRRLRPPTTMCGYRVMAATRVCEAFCAVMARVVESSILQMLPADYQHRTHISGRPL
jgi:hypothetical protein